MKHPNLAERELLEALHRRECVKCGDDIRNSPHSHLPTYYRTAMCIDCYVDDLKERHRMSSDKSIQLDLKEIGAEPKPITMNAVSFGTLAATRSYMFRDCIVKTKWLGKECAYVIICPSESSYDEIAKFIRGHSI